MYVYFGFTVTKSIKEVKRKHEKSYCVDINCGNLIQLNKCL